MSESKSTTTATLMTDIPKTQLLDGLLVECGLVDAEARLQLKWMLGRLANPNGIQDRFQVELWLIGSPFGVYLANQVASSNGVDMVPASKAHQYDHKHRGMYYYEEGDMPDSTTWMQMVSKEDIGINLAHINGFMWIPSPQHLPWSNHGDVPSLLRRIVPFELVDPSETTRLELFQHDSKLLVELRKEMTLIPSIHKAFATSTQYYWYVACKYVKTFNKTLYKTWKTQAALSTSFASMRI